MEHHANIVPWQMLCARVGAELRVIPLNPDGTLQLETLPTLFDEKTRLLAITHVSNVLGTENPLAEMITLAHQHGAKVLVDGAQAVMHHPVDVQALDCDFYVFSGHKTVWPHRNWHSLCERSLVAGDAAVGRGRFYDRHRQPE